MARTHTRNSEIRRLVRERSGGFCEGCGADLSQDDHPSMHHRFMRVHGGKDSVSNLIHLCHKCHTRIHHEHDWAYARGFLISGVTPFEDDPFILRGSLWVYPERDGTLTVARTAVDLDEAV